jgi:penicillin-binding protein 2
VFDKIEGWTVECLVWTNYGQTHGTINAAQAMQMSCNYFFYEIGSRISVDDMDSTAKGLGLGERTGVELPEYIGHRANRESKAALHVGDDKQWYTGDSILAAIGQSENRFTPMQLCVYTSALANQGTRYKATFMNRVVSSDYRQLLDENKPEIIGHMNISDATYATYCQGMYMVTSTLDGTAYSTFRNYPIKVAGKTGTAETGIRGTSANGAFVCFAPLDDPQIAIAVYVEKGGHGSTVAAIGKQVLDAYFADILAGDNVVGENQIS